MRYLIYSLLITVFITGLLSCSDKKSTEDETENVALMVANWNDTTAIGKAVNDFYRDSVLKNGKVFLEVRDGTIRSKIPYHYLQLNKVYRKQFKPTTPTTGYIPVLMTSGSDSVIVDFQIAWVQVKPDDSTGRFVVMDRFIQLAGNQPRYEWIKEEEYWIRKNVEMPPNTKNKGDIIDMKIDKVKK